MADTPEKSDYTSIQLRIQSALNGKQPDKLLSFIGNECLNQPKGINFTLKDYLELVDETGRMIRDDKRGAISANAEKVLARLTIPCDNGLIITADFGKLFHGPVGTLQELTSYCERLGKRRHFSQNCQYFQAG